MPSSLLRPPHTRDDVVFVGQVVRPHDGAVRDRDAECAAAHPADWFELLNACGSRLLSRNFQVAGSEFPEIRHQLADPLDYVVHLIGPHGVPVCRGIDGDNRLFQPFFRLSGQPRHRQVGAALDHSLDVVLVQLEEGIPQLPFRNFRHGGGTVAAKLLGHHNLESAVLQEAGHVPIGHRPVWCQDTNALDVPVAPESRLAGIRLHGDSAVGQPHHVFLQFQTALQSAPQRFR